MFQFQSLSSIVNYNNNMVICSRNFTNKNILTKRFAVAVVLAMLVLATNGERMFGEYLSPKKSYQQGEAVAIWAAPLTSITAQIAKDYKSFPFCQATINGTNDSEESPPSRWVSGAYLSPIPVDVNLMKEVYCQQFCKIDKLTPSQAEQLGHLARMSYHHKFVIDYNLPSAARGLNAATGEYQLRYAGGFPVGFVSIDTNETYVFNHFNLIVDYHQPDRSIDTYHVTRFDVEPMSTYHEISPDIPGDGSSPTFKDCPPFGKHLQRNMLTKSQIIRPGESIIYTYDVIWRETDIDWNHRWDIYLSEDHLVPMQVHVYSIVNTLFILTIMLLIAAIIWIRRIRHAAKLTPVLDEEFDDDGEGGTTTSTSINISTPGTSNDRQKWRLLHGDVFRPPDASPMRLAIFCGIGAQLLSTALICCVLSVIGLMTLIHKLTMIIGMLLCLSLVGSWVGGYTVARVFQELQIDANDSNKRFASHATATLFPGSAMIFFLIMTAWARSLDVPLAFGGMLDIVGVFAMLIFVFIPLSLLGSKQGFSHKVRPFPVETLETPRDIPARSCFMGYFCPVFSFLLNGFWPVSVLYVEFFFINVMLWFGQYFDFFGSMTIVVLLMIMTCACSNILTTYWQLSRENHRWWWTSFRNGAAVGALLFLYSIGWYRSIEATTWYAFVLYFGTQLLICSGISCAFGCISVTSSLWFNRAIFSMITASA